MKSKRRDYIAYGFCLLFGLLIFVNTFTFEKQSSKVGPWLVSVATMVMSTAGIIRTTTRKSPAAKAEEAKTEGDKSKKKAGRHAREMGPYARASSWLVGLTAGVIIVGFLPTIAIFSGAYVKTHEGKWKPAIITAIAMTIVTYLVFIDLLETPLFKGVIPEIGPLIGGERLW